ncbi:exotoxin beta-grasp domain-containing protein [Staphylococcus hyicus]|uniref:enterotoxin-like toxin X n=1 Tax=Staphylococcus hyicus TaxID=1284 RepID=UPI002738F44E|nr:toxin [Staphylococcus hyicus]MDP4467901.1 toxin [Staphylococcus hyicus]
MPLKLLTKFTMAGIILTGFTGTAALGSISNISHADTSDVQEVQTQNEAVAVKKLYDRYSKSQIGDKKGNLKIWAYSNAPLKSNEVRLNFKGTYIYNGTTYTPKRNVTLDKGVITLKELDHIVRYAHVSYGLYLGDKLPKGDIVINTKSGDRYTLETHKALQSHRENVEINTDELKDITFKITAS